jgi:flagellar biosynthetic protein FlhB
VSEQAAERTEQATARRWEEARRKGQVAISREVSVAVSLAAMAAAGSFMGLYAFALLTAVMRHWLAAAGTTAVNQSTLPSLAWRAGWDVLTPAVPFGLFILVLGVGAQILQGGWIWSTERLQWDPGRLNPISGLRRMISARSLVELAKAFLKIGLIAVVVFWHLKDEILALPLLLQMEPQAAFFRAAHLAVGMILWIAAVLTILAAGDYAYQRWQLGRDLRMSRQEVKQEQRETEGDPIIRSRIRSLQREKARRRMMQEVPKADVVITNPTHLAVALKYDGVLMSAPIVVAKGAGFIAERIREVASENGVPIIENKPLARSLHALVDIGREIPSELYQAVAEILAMVLRARGRL